jgi:hypothetical protein
MIGLDTRLTKYVNGVLVETEFAAKVIELAAEHKDNSGKQVRLIVLDHAGTFHGGDFNAREDASLTMRIVNHIAQETGAAVVLLAHSPKSASMSESSDAMAIAGSTAFVDHARGAFILATMRPTEAKEFGILDDQRHNFVSLAVVKNNYGPTGDVAWFERRSPQGWGVGVLVPVTLQKAIKGVTRNSGVTARVKQFVADNPGQHSKTAVRDSYSGKSRQLKASKSEVAVALDDLLGNGEIVARPPTVEERKKFAIAHAVKTVLDVPNVAVVD